MNTLYVKEILEITAKEELLRNPKIDLGEVDPKPAVAELLKERGYNGLRLPGTGGRVYDCSCKLPEIFCCRLIAYDCIATRFPDYPELDNKQTEVILANCSSKVFLKGRPNNEPA